MGCIIPVKGEVLEIDPPATPSELLAILHPYRDPKNRTHWKATKIRDGSAWIADTFATKENHRVMDGMDVTNPTVCGTVLYLSPRECGLIQEVDGIQKARALDGVPMLPIRSGCGNTVSDGTRWKIQRAGCIYHTSTALWWASPDVFDEMRKVIEDEPP